jgi:hypothetical protein
MSKKTHIKLNKKQIKKIYLKYLEKKNNKKEKKSKYKTKTKNISIYSPYQFNRPAKRRIPIKYKILLKIRNIFRKIFELLIFAICTEVYKSTMSDKSSKTTTSSYITLSK